MSLKNTQTEPQKYIIFSTKQIIFRVGGYKKNLEFFFSTFRKITVGGFVNQLIKKFWPKRVSANVTVSMLGSLSGLSDQALANLLGVKSSLLYGQNFDVKVDENRFVGFPPLLDDIPDKTHNDRKDSS